MQTLGLSSSQRRAYEAALRGTHTKRIDVDVLSLNGGLISSISPVVVDGQVDVDLDNEVTRTVSLTFLDPSHALTFDTNSPDEGAIYADRMIRIRYGVFVDSMGEYVWCTVFTGPVTGMNRDGAIVSVEAQGKETLTRGAIWNPLVLRKGLGVASAIKVLMVDRGGETSTDIPSARNSAGRLYTLPRTRSLTRESEIWAAAKSIAGSVTRQLFYDGAGVLRFRAWPTSSVLTFADGTGGSVVSIPTVNYQMADVKNTVIVRGQGANGKKAAIAASAMPNKDHPLSPWRLGRTGSPRYLVEVIEDDSIRTYADALKRAEQRLDDILETVIEVEFDSLPMPHLDVGDRVRLETGAFAGTFRLRRFSIPLASTGDPVMSVGYNRRLTPTKRSRRRGKK